LDNLSTGAGNYFWSFGNGANSQEETPNYTYPVAGTFTLTLTASSTDGNCSDQAVTTVTVLVTSVEERDFEFRSGPNPVSDTWSYVSEVPVQAFELFDAVGRSVLRQVPAGEPVAGTLDFSALPAGLYAVRVETAAGLGTVRVVVER
jgi:PKD repeat protein